jgi:hypothetical protein
VTHQIPKDTLSLRSTLPALAAYLFLTILMTWPASLYLTEAIPGDGFDGWQNYWNLWWVKQALLVQRTNPFFTPYLYAPNGVSLLFHTLNIFNGLWTLPLQLNFGLAIAYNSVVLLSFSLAGYGGYLLSLYTLTRLFPSGRGLRLAAFSGGLIFTMSPFHMAHLLGHMQVFSMIWPPFYILWLLRSLDPWATTLTPPPHQRRNTAISSLYLILAGLVDWYHALYLLIFTGLVLLWTLWRRWRALSGNLPERIGIQGTSTLKFLKVSLSSYNSLLQPLWIVLAIGLGFGVVLSPLLMPMIGAARTRADLETGLFQNITLSADLLAFVLPSELHPLWGDWAKTIASNFSSTTSERLIFAGYVPLALALFIVMRRWVEPIVKFWAFIVLVFFILALGPYLHIGGHIITVAGRPLPLPYFLLYYIIPFLNLTRSLSRYDLMIMLGLGVLSSIALIQLTMNNYQLSNSKTPPLPSTSGPTHYALRFTFYVSRFTHPALLLPPLLICLEFLAIPYPISKIDTPQFYDDIGAQTEDYTIAALPMNWDRPTPLLHQTTHHKRLLTAYTSRDNPLELAWRTPVFQHWRYLGPDIIDQPLEQIAPTIFFDFNLRYIVLDYWQMPPGPEREGTERWVTAALPAGYPPIYDDGRLKVYQSPAKTETRPYLTLGDGWGPRQDLGNGLIIRTLSDQARPAELFLHHPQNRPYSLEITAASDQAGAQNLAILAGDKLIGNLRPGPAFSTQTINLPPSADPFVKLRLKTDHEIDIIRVSSVSLAPLIQD